MYDGSGCIFVLGIEIFDEIIVKGIGVIFVLGYFVNWEFLFLVVSGVGLSGGEVYCVVNNFYVNKWLVC